MNSNVDTITLETLRHGNHAAFETVFIAYYSKVKTFIYSYIKSEADAEELAEELFVNLWINHRSINTSKSFDSYLHTIARNAAINYLKHKHVEDSYLDNTSNQTCSSTSEEELIARELGILIDDTVEKMPQQRKEIYKLSRNEGLSNEEISVTRYTFKNKI